MSSGAFIPAARAMAAELNQSKDAHLLANAIRQPAPQQPESIQDKVSRVFSRLDEAEKITVLLRDRLQSVLAPLPDENETTSSLSPSQGCPLADQLYEMERRIGVLIALNDQILRRLRL